MRKKESKNSEESSSALDRWLWPLSRGNCILAKNREERYEIDEAGNGVSRSILKFTRQRGNLDEGERETSFVHRKKKKRYWITYGAERNCLK